MESVIALMLGGVVGLALLALLLLVLYWIIRLAVRHAMRDADASRVPAAPMADVHLAQER